jgi:hypothetical protein
MTLDGGEVGAARLVASEKRAVALNTLDFLEAELRRGNAGSG